ncbi:MAG: NUDIX hydrolase [Crocinitomicaceae bacterium]|nr:NUDIX hydrolase [Crocinitomicaceae bacterium]
MVTRFNLRVYGIVLNDKREVLVSHERRGGYEFTKFPGGGVELGEGILDALHREFKEELDAVIDTSTFFYVNEHFQASNFKSSDQVISFYYRVTLDYTSIKTGVSNLPLGSSEMSDFERVSWVPLSQDLRALMTFPIDKMVLTKIL